MDKSFPQQGSQTQQRRSLAGPRILHRFENWLTHLVQLVQLTDEEQTDAGVRIGQLSEEEQKGAGISQ